MLTIEHLTKRFGTKVAVNDLTLHIDAGDIVGFIGHNGAGKTTTLRAVSGILIPDGGRITIGGYDLETDPIACKRQFAYLPDNPDVYDYLTGQAYVNFMADVYGVATADRHERLKRFADLLEITSSLDTPIREYSHGMKQKIALIGALIHNPKLLMLDEPFVGLDPVSTHRLRDLLREMCAQGTAVFFSTHVLEVAEKLCNRVAIIRQGQLVMEGATADVIGNASLEDVFLELEKDDVH